ncbi:16S rRNA (cytosine(1402)-N(4))-methyltransferase RsmH [Patescibacteria group bacterium]|nr:16S rRNA (cytosine(1402)-N(4))-methyltransferase RsmH [Patescibacteria group bacterium]MBU1123991.1 16S rRNA (cytosine(1402)-N(4))-methyltransferase RsmH [Patescibacteria group bacterium]
MQHLSVLHNEVLALLDPKAGESVLDVTLGLGGHSKSFLEKIGDSGHLTGIEADENNLKLAQERLKAFENQTELVHANFREIELMNLPIVDIIFADLGLSSPHLDDPDRGFTFRENAPLDMRFDRSNGITAAQLIKSLKEEELANIFWKFGELRTSRRLARAIKEKEQVKTTLDLKECIEKSAGYKARDILPQVFQSLRIAVNDELGSLEVLLNIGPKLLKKGGRMGIISFHSLEDRMVKKAFRELSQPMIDDVTGAVTEEAPFEVITKRPVFPSEEEVEGNSRARSAKLRVIRRVERV